MANPLDFVTEDLSDDGLSPFEQAKSRGISIRSANGSDVMSAGNDPLSRAIAPQPQAQQPWTMEDIVAGLAALKEYVANGEFSPGTKVGNRLFGTGGEERYQTWPEKMIRSGVGAAGNALSSLEPVTSEQMIAPAMDMAGLAGGSALIERPGAASLGSGPVRQFRRGANENLNPEAMPNAPEFYVKPSRNELFVAPVKKEYKAYPEIDDPNEWRVIEISHDAYGQTSKDYKSRLSPKRAKSQAQQLTTEAPINYVVAGGKDDPHIGQQFKSEAEARSFIRKNRKTVHDLYMRDPRTTSVEGRKYQGEDVHLTGFDTPEAAHEALAHLNSGGNYDLTGGFKMLPGSSGVRKFYENIKPSKDLADHLERYPNTEVLGDITAPIEKLQGKTIIDTSGIKRSQKVEDRMKSDKGYIERLLVDQQGLVEEGQHRLDALDRMGIKEIPVTVVKRGTRPITIMSDTQQPGAAIAAAVSSKGPAPVFYSALEHAATNAAQDVMSPQQWLGYLKNQPGVKAEELAWTGIGDWLAGQKGKVKKEDVQRYLDEHKVEIKDVTKGDHSIDWDKMEAAFEDAHERSPHDHAELQDFVRDNEGYMDDHGLLNNGPKYSSYQLPGGENYREHLLTLPSKPADRLGGLEKRERDLEAKLIKQFKKENKIDGPVDPDQNVRMNRFLNEHPELKIMREEAAELASGLNGREYRSSHWDEPNVLAHVRTNDRMVDAVPIAEIEAKVVGAYPHIKLEHMGSGMVPRAVEEGVLTPQEAADWSRARGFITGYKKGEGFESQLGTGKKSLHIEEIQSDWHQQGRKQGYKPDRASATKHFQEIEGRAPKDEIELSQWMQHAPEAAVHQYGVPDAPFKTSWPELALKRMIRHAAENGYDRISWTPGEAQAARYDLSKHYSKIRVERSYQEHADGNIPTKTWWPVQKNNTHGESITTDMDGKIVKAGRTWGDIKGKNISDVVGKDIAEKGLKGGDTVSLKDVDLRVGGEGMREFYDKMLPKTAEKIGKAHGVKVKQTELKPSMDEIADARSQGLSVKTAQPVKVHYFDIPQSLRDHAIGKGFPLYMSGIPFPLTPVDYDPFKKERK